MAVEYMDYTVSGGTLSVRVKGDVAVSVHVNDANLGTVQDGAPQDFTVNKGDRVRLAPWGFPDKDVNFVVK